MKDRTSKYPGRVKLVPVVGQENTYDLAWADEPVQDGTPLNKATLLSDAVAALLDLGQGDPTVSDAFDAIYKHYAKITVAQREPDTSDVGCPGHLWLVTTDAAGECELYMCAGIADDGGYVWTFLHKSRKQLTYEIFYADTTWVMPATAIGDVRITVFGGGGSGGVYPGFAGGGGGGGGMATWTGALEEGKRYYITVGKGGVGNASYYNGVAGGSSSFGSVVSAAGGNGGKQCTGGNGGSGGGAGYYNTSSAMSAGSGSYGGSGGVVFKKSSTPAGRGVNTADEFDHLPESAIGTGTAGENFQYTEALQSGGGGGGGGYGGCGGNGTAYGGGGGGGYGSAGNGGNGGASQSERGGDGGIAAGGGGSGYSYASENGGKGGDGIVIISYYEWRV